MRAGADAAGERGLMLVSAGWAEARLRAADIWAVTALFFVLVLLAATQDIAVDGWALTLLSRPNIGCVHLLGVMRSAGCFALSGDAFCSACHAVLGTHRWHDKRTHYLDLSQYHIPGG